MPVAHHHQLFSAIGTFLHARHNNTNPNSTSSQGIAPTGGGDGASEVALLYQTFEACLTQRLSSLLLTEDASCFSLSSFNEFIGLLLATQTDLRPLIPTRTMDEFLERSIKVLDVCRDIKEQIIDVESLQGMLQVVAPCLMSKDGRSINEGKRNRARKILAQLLFHMEAETGDDPHHHVEMRRSFGGKLRERLSGPHRRKSLHGHQDSTAAASDGNNMTPASTGHVQAPSLHDAASSGQHPSWHETHTSHAASAGALHSLELSLLPPKLLAGDEEECFSAAIYAFNVCSVFFLGTITAAFPNFGIKAHVIAAIHPPSSFGWTAAFLRLQEKVQEEHRMRNKKRFSQATMWELDLLSSLIKRLFELMSPECFPWSADNEEEVKRLVSQFDDHVHDLERELAVFNTKIIDFYNRIVSDRSEVLDLMSITSC